MKNPFIAVLVLIVFPLRGAITWVSGSDASNEETSGTLQGGISQFANATGVVGDTVWACMGHESPATVVITFSSSVTSTTAWSYAYATRNDNGVTNRCGWAVFTASGSVLVSGSCSGTGCLYPTIKVGVIHSTSALSLDGAPAFNSSTGSIWSSGSLTTSNASKIVFGFGDWLHGAIINDQVNPGIGYTLVPNRGSMSVEYQITTSNSGSPYVPTFDDTTASRTYFACAWALAETSASVPAIQHKVLWP